MALLVNIIGMFVDWANFMLIFQHISRRLSYFSLFDLLVPILGPLIYIILSCLSWFELNFYSDFNCVGIALSTFLISTHSISKASYSSSSSSNDPFNGKVRPIRSFSNLHIDRFFTNMFNALTDRSGIYCIVNRVTNEIYYVGQYINLSDRLYEQLVARRANSPLHQAIHMRGLSVLTVFILEYTSGKALLARERYFINLLNPLFNVGSSGTNPSVAIDIYLEGKFIYSASSINLAATLLGISSSTIRSYLASGKLSACG
uniref:Orf259 n=1 Tax=Spizellomyces punctatus TaxID=109760 RepID=Q950S7_SPIPN|nr:orf259 [Spizellomyces punctatus]AAK84231.1 orf259 [Spizellomyces punctatus]